MNSFGEVGEKLRRSTVEVRTGRAGAGSGVIWDSDGLVVTNAHVARGDQAWVELWDGRRIEGAVTSRDPSRDLASIRVNAADLPAAVAGDSGALRPGELVIAVGNPLGFTGALSTGVVHGVGPFAGLGARSWVQADVRLLPGNSGGPLAEAGGRVIGLNTMIARGLALAVPSNTVRDFLTRGATPALGVALRPVPVEFDRARSLGLLVLEVEPASAASAASILPGDLLLGAGGRRFASPDDLAEALRGGGPVLRLDFLRGDRRRARQVSVQLDQRRAMAA